MKKYFPKKNWGTTVTSMVEGGLDVNNSFTGNRLELLDRHSSIVTSLLVIMAKKNVNIFHHCTRVAGYSLQIAFSLGLSAIELEYLVVSALLHDIGKVGVSDRILHKCSSLSDAEWEIVKQHGRNGADILSPYSGLHALLPAILHHHERYDGQGYPDHLSGTKIPLHARIISVADTYDAIVTDRPYRTACSHSFACTEIDRVAGSHLDPIIVGHFLSISQSDHWFKSSTGLPTDRWADQNLTIVA